MPRWQGYAIVSLVAAIVMLTNLGGPRLWDRDEPRNAGCAAEMLVRGDWVVPVFNAELRTHKPVLLYWLMMAAYSVFGISEFTARLPSALLAIGTALCTLEMGRHLFSPRAGVWAGVVVATSLMFVVAGRAATPDAALVFFSTLVVTLFALGIPTAAATSATSAITPANGEFLSWSRAVGLYAAMALAVLAKGPVGIVLPAAVIGLYQLLSFHHPTVDSPRGWQEWFLDLIGRFTPLRIVRTYWYLRPITALIVTVAIAAPWYVWVGLRTDGEFLRGFFLEHNLNRAMTTMEGHRGNVLFYPVTLLLGMFPWSVFAVPLVIDLRQRFIGQRPRAARTTDRAGYLLAGCWLAIYLGVFSVAKTKLPSYVTPCYPAVALLLGVFLQRWCDGELRVSRVWMQAACCVLALVGAVVVIAIPIVTQEKLPGEEWLGMIGIVPLTAGLYAWWATRREHPRRAARTIAVAATAFATLLFAIGAYRADQHQLNHRLLSTIRDHSTSPRVAAFGCLEPSWVFYGGFAIDEITENGVGPTHSPFVAVGSKWLPKSPVTFADVASHEDAFIITSKRQLGEVRARLPKDFQVLETVPLFLKSDELVLLGRPNPVVVARRNSR